MTPQHNPTTAHRQTTPGHRLRLELDTAGTSDGDGFWWPHSRDLTTELPDLLTSLTPRLGPIQRVIYHLDEWEPAPRKLEFAGRRVRLDGYRNLPARLLEVHGVDIGARLVLRIITPGEDAETVAARQLWDSEGGAAARAGVIGRGRSVSR
ncbi:DUF5994 family protein [Nocardia sp. NBC_00511]|uniref:DUF5994 family protein n=1 Tax=Nocardia sp. NBC_00511 TaxID=2903591 RepID=UPI0030E0EA6C